jgi:AcrR family transcriptional regulator
MVVAAAKPVANRRPGRPPGRTSDGTRAKILKAARVCFASKGFDLATNRDIAALAGITSGAIYQYFDSKAALYATTAREAIAEVAKHMRAYTNANADSGVGAGLSHITHDLLAVHLQDPSVAPFLIAMPTELQRHPDIARELQPNLDTVPSGVMTLVQRGVQGGEIARADAARVVGMYIACLLGLTHFAVIFGPDEGARATKAFTELLEGGLLPRSRTTRAKKRVKRTSSSGGSTRRT